MKTESIPIDVNTLTGILETIGQLRKENAQLKNEICWLCQELIKILTKKE